MRMVSTCTYMHIPKKYLECKVPLGMENGNIQDDQITASSQWNSATHGTTRARLNLLPSSGAGGWVALQHTVDEWLQVDLRSQYTSVTGLATQGRNDHDQWVTKYYVQYSYDGVKFEYYKENGQSLRKVTESKRLLNRICSCNTRLIHAYMRFLVISPHSVSHLSKFFSSFL